MKRQILIKPLVHINGNLTGALKTRLEEIFECPVEVSEQLTNLEFAFAPKRKQYLSQMILTSLKSPGSCDRVLAIINLDLYSPGLNYIFGEADLAGGVAVVSTYRLRPERYGLPADDELYRSRVLKEALHELGHTFYLNHCLDPNCVMHFSSSLADTDKKKAGFCLKCQQKLKEAESNCEQTS